MTSKKENELIAKNFREYRIWRGVVSRGIGKTNSRIYFERGISVCDSWLSFTEFLSDMGPCGKYMSLDRIDVNKGYSPDNCRWADAYTQANNKQRTRRITYLGKETPISEVAFKTGIPSGVIAWRMSNRGIGASKAIKIPHESKYMKSCRLGGIPIIPIRQILDHWTVVEAGRIKKIEVGFHQLRELLTVDGVTQYPPPPRLEYNGVPLFRPSPMHMDELRLVLKDGLFTIPNPETVPLGEHHKFQSRNLLPNSVEATKIYVL